MYMNLLFLLIDLGLDGLKVKVEIEYVSD